MNGYPLRLVSEVINSSWVKETKKSILRENPAPATEAKKHSEYDDFLLASSKVLRSIYKKNCEESTLE